MLQRTFFAWFMLVALAQADTIAITEFFNQPIGEPGGRQWIELFNYGDASVDLKGWRLVHHANAQLDFDTPLVIQPGDYAILVLSYNGLPRAQLRQVFQTEWLDGRPDPRVYLPQQGNLTLGAGGELTLLNRRRQSVWSLVYRNDGTPGRATFFAMDNFRLLKRFGARGEPGVVRAGQDAGVTGGEFLGYEGNNQTNDPLAASSKVEGLMTGFEDLYNADAPRGKAEPGVGSPLQGRYTAKK